MTIDANVKRLLLEAETSLAQVLRSLISADSNAMAVNERRLIDLVEIFGQIEKAVRINRSLPIRDSLLAIRTMLGQSRILSSLALRTIVSQMESRDLFPTGPYATLSFEG